MQPITFLILALAIVAFVAISFLNNVRRINKKSEHRLPGPMLLPYIGRIHDMPIQHMWKKFKSFADIHGPIYYTEMLGTKFIVVSDEKIAEDLLVKKAKYNSDRPAVRSLFDSKSTHGSMEYLPLMGHNRMCDFSIRSRKMPNMSQSTGPGNVALHMAT